MIVKHFFSTLPWAAAALALMTAWCSALAADESLRDRVDRLANPYVENDMVVGMTIGVLHKGEEAVFGYGRFSNDDDRLPDGDTVYEIGSTSKVFTGVLLADAVVQGRVKLNQPASQLLPSGVTMPAHGERAITMLDLSTHVSGLPRLPSNMKRTDPNNPYADFTAGDLHAFLNGYKLRRAPGEKFEYSNLAQGLLGHLLAREREISYEQLLTDRIAGPLEMTSTTLALSKDQQFRLAPPHLAGGKRAKNWDIPTLAGAGGILGTANDLLKFTAAHLHPPKGEFGKAIDLAWEMHQEPLAKGNFAMGLGWHIARDGTTRWHNGQTGGYHAMWMVNRKINAGVILLTNSATGEVDQLAEKIMRMLAGAKVEPRMFRSKVP